MCFFFAVTKYLEIIRFGGSGLLWKGPEKLIVKIQIEYSHQGKYAEDLQKKIHTKLRGGEKEK